MQPAAVRVQPLAIIDHNGPDLGFGRAKTEAFFASTIGARVNKAWKEL